MSLYAQAECAHDPACVMSYFPLLESTERRCFLGSVHTAANKHTMLSLRETAPPHFPTPSPSVLDYLADYKLRIPWDNTALKGYFPLFCFVLFLLSVVTFNKIKWANSDCLLSPTPPPLPLFTRPHTHNLHTWSENWRQRAKGYHYSAACKYENIITGDPML